MEWFFWRRAATRCNKVTLKLFCAHTFYYVYGTHAYIMHFRFPAASFTETFVEKTEQRLLLAQTENAFFSKSGLIRAEWQKHRCSEEPTSDNWKCDCGKRGLPGPQLWRVSHTPSPPRACVWSHHTSHIPAATDEWQKSQIRCCKINENGRAWRNRGTFFLMARKPDKNCQKWHHRFPFPTF